MSTNKSLDEVFDVTPTEISIEKPEKKPLSRRQKDALVPNINELKEQDVSYVRGKLLQMTEMLAECAQESLESALENGHPRGFEVSSNAAKQCAEVAEKLVHLQGSNRRLDEDRVSVNATQNNTNVTNNVMFSGSTADLFAEMKKLNQADKDK
jgi:hypothetical protein